MRPVISLYYRNILLYIFSAFDTVGTGDRKDILPARNPALKALKVLRWSFGDPALPGVGLISGK